MHKKRRAPRHNNRRNNKNDKNVPLPRPFAPPRFAVDDEEGYRYLEEHGYAVFKHVLTPEEVVRGRDLAWDFLEGLQSANIKRDDPSTWSEGWPDRYGNGIIVASGVGHSAFLWFVRGIPNVQRIYAKIWDTEELITSYDGFCMHRPFEYNASWLSATGWYHLDQNGSSKPSKICVQGLVNFYDSDEDDGGLVVVPDSCKVFNDIFNNRPQFAHRGDFVKLSTGGPNSVWEKEIKEAGIHPIKVCAKAGDMLLWDSRTIHCNAPASTPRPLPKEEDGAILPPRRLVAYVCMTPASRLTPQILHERRDAFVKGNTTSHWPEDCRVAGRVNDTPNYKPPVLSPEVAKLIPLYEGDELLKGSSESNDEEKEDAGKRGGRNKRI